MACLTRNGKLGYMDRAPYIVGTLEDRFWPKVAISSGEGCWEWQAATDGKGYGVIGCGSANPGGVYKAHRAAWMLTYGDPGEKFVCHSCDNPSCVNPAHLFLGDALDNARDMAGKGRHGRVVSPRSNRAKLTAAEVLEMRRLSDEGLTNSEIARRFPHVRTNTVSRAVRGLTWRNLNAN